MSYQIGDERLPLRFWSKVEENPATGCWEWTRAISTAGYGRFGFGRKDKAVYAHRICYSAIVGEIPAGLDLDHLCRNRSCCNPAHLEPVTRRVNLLRGNTVTARSAAATHCPQGHPYDEANTNIINVRGGRGLGRQCRACNKKNCSAWYQAKKLKAASK